MNVEQPSATEELKNHNAWPCRRCGMRLKLKQNATLPWLSYPALLLFFLWLVLGILRPFAVDLPYFLGTLAWLLAMALYFQTRKNRLWICSSCGHQQPPRKTLSGSPCPIIVIPTYNNQESIAAVIADAYANTSGIPIWVVDDGSDDRSPDDIKSSLAVIEAPKHAYIRLKKNQGKGAAIKAALTQAVELGHSHILVMDGDGQHLGSEIPKLLSALELAPNAMTIGVRDFTAENVPQHSKFGRRFSNFWIQAQTGRRVLDSQSGMRIYPSLPTLSLGSRAKRYNYEVEVLTLGARAGLPFFERQIDCYYPPAHERVSHFHKIRDNVRISLSNIKTIIQTPFWLLGWPYRFSDRPPGSPKASFASSAPSHDGSP